MLHRLLSSPSLMLRHRFSSSGAQSNYRIIQSLSNDIHFNLAVQQYLFQIDSPYKQSSPTTTLFIFRNSPTIVIGRHQNPWKECHISQMQESGTKLARRKSGGGAVYQDLGNTCWSFIGPVGGSSNDNAAGTDYKTRNNSILIQTFRQMGIQAEVTGRNDITVNGKKVSGAAYRLGAVTVKGTSSIQQGQSKPQPLASNHRNALHHGTVLISVDTSALTRLLNPNKKKLESKGVQSVASRVMNLSEKYPHVNHSDFCSSIYNVMRKAYAGQLKGLQYVNETMLSDELGQLNLSNSKTINPIPQKLAYFDPQAKSHIMSAYNRLRSWSWLYGQCPSFKYQFSNKFVWGLVEVTLDVSHGYITTARIYSDCLVPEVIATASQELNGGIRYDAEGLKMWEDRTIHQLKLTDGMGLSELEMIQQMAQWMKTVL